MKHELFSQCMQMIGDDQKIQPLLSSFARLSGESWTATIVPYIKPSLLNCCQIYRVN